MKPLIPLCCLFFICISCVQNTPYREYMIIDKDSLEIKVPVATQIEKLKEKGFQVFSYVDDATKDTVIMQQYFMAFLKKGPNRNQSEEEATKLQEAHQAHLGRMYELGYADISGPFGDDGELRGVTVYNVPTLKMADSLANLDPMMKAGRLKVEIKPWWAGKGYPLR